MFSRCFRFDSHYTKSIMPPLPLAAIICSSGDNKAVSVLVKFVVGSTDAVSGGTFGIGTFGKGICGFGKLLLLIS